VDWYGKITDKYLPPYLLGLWLGDGHSNGPAVTTPDAEIVQYLCAYTVKRGLKLRYEPQKDNKSSVYHITSGYRRSDSLLASLQSNDLICNKHIPRHYKTASRADRLQLLAGLLDSDGHLKRGGYDVVFKQKVLAEDTVFVARSLGLAAYVQKCRKTCTNTGATGMYYRFNICGDTDMVPIKIPWKKAPKRKQKKNVLMTGISVSEIGDGEYYGFEISGDGLFLLGDFTVTHNTVIFADKLAAEPGVTFAIAHRQELLSQISMALAKFGVTHSIQAPKPVVRWIVHMHMQAFGRHYFDPQAKCLLAGVLTLLNRASTLSNAINQARLWVVDEAGHLLRKNVWGKAVALFPASCKGLGVTATPERADGHGIGREAEGVFDALVSGPSGRDLINAGYLSEYRIFAPPASIDMNGIPTGKTGDWSLPKLTTASRKSTITGDVVDHYLKIAPGKLGVTFVTDIDTGVETAAKFRSAGVPAEMVHAKTPDKIRQTCVERLGSGDLKNLVNVDIFGEGFDLPAIEVVSDGAPTCSFGRFSQRFGRGLRIMDGKKYAVYIDHVGNIMRHGLPDAPRDWSMDSRERRTNGAKDPDLVPTRTCRKCTAVYEGFSLLCPYCGYLNEPAGRSSIEQVEGDLMELDPTALAAMRGEQARIDAPESAVGDKMRHAHAPDIAVMGAMKQHRVRQEAQGTLREAMALWAGYQRAAGVPDAEGYRRFYHRFGIDVMAAQCLGRREAAGLERQIRGWIG
jgi:DNA repair protein RadD